VKKQIHIRIDEEVLDKIDERAWEANRTRANYINQVLSDLVYSKTEKKIRALQHTA